MNAPDDTVDMEVRWLGRVEFARALALQEEIVSRRRNVPWLKDQLLLLEHEPVYTIGRTPDQSSLSATGPHTGRIRPQANLRREIPFSLSFSGDYQYRSFQIERFYV